MAPVAWKTLATAAGLMGALTLGQAAAQPSGLTVPGVVEGDVVNGRVARVCAFRMGPTAGE